MKQNYQTFLFSTSEFQEHIISPWA